jgi:hypothetical protein
MVDPIEGTSLPALALVLGVVALMVAQVAAWLVPVVLEVVSGCDMVVKINYKGLP